VRKFWENFVFSHFFLKMGDEKFPMIFPV